MSVIQFPSNGKVEPASFSSAFLESILDSMLEHVTVIDHEGAIQYCNQSWLAFAEKNQCAVDDWAGHNYLQECDRAAQSGDELAGLAATGIREVISGERAIFFHEYPCDSLNIKRWFMMRVSSFQVYDKDYCIICHQDISKLKLQEAQAKFMSDMASIDELTQIANRRKFDEYYQMQFKQCAREKKPISIAMIDIDYFKLHNDSYGHHAGDSTLKSIATVLQSHANRPSDLCARYGGEEFAMVWGDTDFLEANRQYDLI